jgi:hypothetical protein
MCAALKTTVLFQKKFKKRKSKKMLLFFKFIMQLFSVDAKVFSEEIKRKVFGLENMKKLP